MLEIFLILWITVAEYASVSIRLGGKELSNFWFFSQKYETQRFICIGEVCHTNMPKAAIVAVPYLASLGDETQIETIIFVWGHPRKPGRYRHCQCCGHSNKKT